MTKELKQANQNLEKCLKKKPWKYFVTLPTKTYLTKHTDVEKMEHQANSFVIKVNEQLFGRNYRRNQKGIEYFYVLEKSPSSNRLHFHFLLNIGENNTVSPSELKRIWVEKCDGYNDKGLIEEFCKPYDPKPRPEGKDHPGYILKIINKPGSMLPEGIHAHAGEKYSR